MSKLTFEDISEDFYSDEIVQKIEAVKKLHIIAENMGKNDTISKLIPALENWVTDNDDEALCNLASELSNFTTVFPGDDIKLIAPLLKSLAQVEEVTVRDAACASMVKVINILSPPVLVESIFPLLKSLGDNEWFTSRVSLAQLILPFYKRIKNANLPEVKEQLTVIRDVFFLLCHDDSPMTKRAGANIFIEAIEVFGKEYLDKMIDLYKNFYDDGNDVICMISLSACNKLLIMTEDIDDRESILSVFENCLLNKSWKLRSKAAEELGNIISVCNAEEVKKYLLAPFTSLLRDHENEVKIQASKQIAIIYKCVPLEAFKTEVLPYLHNLCIDNNVQVREGITQSIIDILAFNSENASTVIPLFQDLFFILVNDIAPSVRLILVSNIDKLLSYPSLITSIEPLYDAEENSWRIREQIVLHINDLAKYYSQDVMDSKIIPIYLHSFVDSFSSVRVAARNVLKTILTEQGPQWVQIHIYPSLVKLYETNHSYLIKSNILYTYAAIFKATQDENVKTELLNKFFKAMTDPTPNIRFICCKIFINIYTYVSKETLNNEIIPHINALLTDSDLDVIYYSQLALDTFNNQN